MTEQLPVPARAIVIGANTAIDMAVQIQRLGADEVTLVYRRGFEAMSATEHEQHIAKRKSGPHAHLGPAAGAAGRCRPRARHAL
jgi:NADPH-dependent glutamate synthase beta subunit-like oxidoreductase